jgi:hypothetical protein
MDTKDQIVDLVREIAELNSKIADYWLDVQRCVGDAHKDEAISLLNTYFRTKSNLEGVEARLKSMLHTHYPDK